VFCLFTHTHTHTDLDRTFYWLPVRMMQIVLGSTMRLEHFRTRVTGLTKKITADLVQISNSPSAVYVDFIDRDQMVRVAADLPSPIEVCIGDKRFFLFHPFFLGSTRTTRTEAPRLLMLRFNHTSNGSYCFCIDEAKH
jgi:hypothetical protein